MKRGVVWLSAAALVVLAVAIAFPPIRAELGSWIDVLTGNQLVVERAVAPTFTTIQSTPTPTDLDGVEVFPGASIQAVVDAHPAGTTFYLRSGLHSGQTIKPRNGDKFIGEPGTILSGEDRIEFAFRSGAADVTIRDLIIENYANPAQSGAIAGAGDGWLIVDNEIRNNWGGGVALNDGYQVIGNNIHHNLQIGIKGSGTDVLIEANEIAFNNYRDDYDPAWEAGGTKFLQTTNLVVRGNYVHDNHGHGLWTDHNNIGTLYEDNVVINNHGAGIHHEISYDGIIRNNKVEGNGFLHSKGGIRIASSSNVEIYGNTLKINNGGIYVSQKERGSGVRGTFEVENLWVHDNTISFNQGVNGLRVHDGGDAYYNNKNNRFDRNDYSLSIPKPFFWMGKERTSQEWTAYGQDENGTFN